LIISPHNANIRLKFIESAPRHPKTLDHFRSMRSGMSHSVVHTPLIAHRPGPVLHRAQMLRQRSIGQADLDATAQISLSAQTGIRSNTKPQDLTHWLSFCERAAARNEPRMAS
jgi:hypothetical protein